MSWNKGLKGYTNAGSFKKGVTPWNKGKTLSEEYKNKLRGKKHSKKRKYRKGKNHPNWKRGYWINDRGYKEVEINYKKFYIHRLIMEKYLGRPLIKSEIVHHKNFNKLDNRIENLELTNRKKHASIHSKYILAGKSKEEIRQKMSELGKRNKGKTYKKRRIIKNI